MQGDLEAAIAMAQRLEGYRGGDGAKVGGGGKGSKKYKNQNQKRVQRRKLRGNSFGRTI